MVIPAELWQYSCRKCPRLKTKLKPLFKAGLIFCSSFCLLFPVQAEQREAHGTTEPPDAECFWPVWCINVILHGEIGGWWYQTSPPIRRIKLQRTGGLWLNEAQTAEMNEQRGEAVAAEPNENRIFKMQSVILFKRLKGRWLPFTSRRPCSR